MDTLNETLKKAMLTYAGHALNGRLVLTSNVDNTLFSVIFIGKFKGRRVVDTSLVARIENDTIIIEHDMNDKILLDCLLQMGVPREKIILAYAGEATPEPIPHNS